MARRAASGNCRCIDHGELLALTGIQRRLDHPLLDCHHSHQLFSVSRAMARRNLCFRSSRSSPSSVSCKDSISGGTMTVSTDCDQHPWGNSRLRWWTTRWLHRCSLLVRPRRLHNGFKGLCSVFVTAAFAFAGTELVGLPPPRRPTRGNPCRRPSSKSSGASHSLHCLSGPCGALSPVHRAASAQRKGVVGCQSFTFRHRHQ
jgi:hypothetical protein